jgi:hypothetical protein
MSSVRTQKGTFAPQSHKLSEKEKHKRYVERAKATPEGRATLLLNKCRQRAREKKFSFGLTKEWVAEKIKTGRCEVSGIPFVLNGGNKHKYAPSLDRADSSKGYTVDNVRVVVWMFNQAKSTYSDDEMFVFCTLYVLFRMGLSR